MSADETSFEPITTQEEFEDRLRDRLARQRARFESELQERLDQQTAAFDLERQTDAAAREVLARKVLVTETHALAAGLGFINPTLALGLVGVDDVRLDEHGELTDADALQQRLTDLVTREPYMTSTATQRSA